MRFSQSQDETENALQALCFLAGANSIFTGDKLLTTANNEMSEDDQMFELLGLKGRPAFLPYEGGAASSDGSAPVPEVLQTPAAATAL